MAGKKIINDTFEQIFETGRDMAKSSVKQIAETLSPWNMISKNFNSTENAHVRPQDKHTPLDLNTLKKSYAEQDVQTMEIMKKRLFQMGRREEEQSLQRNRQSNTNKEHAGIQEMAEQKRREDEHKKRNSLSNAPEGKSGRGTALIGKKRRRQATEPQPAETKPGGGKQ